MQGKIPVIPIPVPMPVPMPIPKFVILFYRFHYFSDIYLKVKDKNQWQIVLSNHMLIVISSQRKQPLQLYYQNRIVSE